MSKRSRLVVKIDESVHRKLKKYCLHNNNTLGWTIEQMARDFLLGQEHAPQGFTKPVKVTSKFGGRGTTDG